MLIMEKLPNIQFVMKIEYKDVYHFSSPCLPTIDWEWLP